MPADWMDPYAAIATNPYMSLPQAEPPNKLAVIGQMLTGLGAGIGQAQAQGLPWSAGIGPGAGMASTMLASGQRQREADAMKRWQMGMLAQQFQDKRDERARKERAIQQAAAEYVPPGLNVRPTEALMGPGSYDTKVASLEGGSKNGGMVFNELGSGAFGPYQFMPATWADVVAKNPNLNLPSDMTKATREQHDAAHNAFKSGNAQALKAAGFQPTPENLYLAHRFGVGGAVSVLRADPNQPLAEVLPIEWQRQNPDMRGQTAGGFRRLATERVGGVGVPYEVAPNAKPTQYALMPDDMPFVMPGGGTTSLRPRTALPSWTAPVMPQPQGPVVQAQYTPPAAAPAPPSDGAPKLVMPPKPGLPPEDAVRIRQAILSGAMTPEQGRAERSRIVNELWSTQKAEAQARYQQESENYRFNRGQAAKDAWEPLDLTDKNNQMRYPGLDLNKQWQRNRVSGKIEQVGGSLVTVNTGDKLMPGQKKVDEKFADDYVEFVSGGGFADSMKMLDQLQEVQKALKSGASLTGPIIGMQGDTLLSFTNPNAMAMRDAVFEVAQRNLRQILGAQFTAKEGEQLIARTYNPRLSEAENAKRIDRLMGQIKTAMEAKIDSARYFEEHGTLRGWKGKLPRMSDFEPAPVPEAKPKADRPPISSFGREVPPSTAAPAQRPPLSSFERGP